MTRRSRLLLFFQIDSHLKYGKGEATLTLRSPFTWVPHVLALGLFCLTLFLSYSEWLHNPSMHYQQVYAWCWFIFVCHHLAAKNAKFTPSPIVSCSELVAYGLWVCDLALVLCPFRLLNSLSEPTRSLVKFPTRAGCLIRYLPLSWEAYCHLVASLFNSSSCSTASGRSN